MLNFRFYNPTEIVFGRDAHLQAGAKVRPFAQKVLLHYGGGSIKRSGVYDAVTASLRAAGIAWAELGGVRPNPRLSLVNEGIRLCREQDISFILAVGGGSVIDSAKAIAIGACYDGDVWDFYRKERTPEAALGIGVVLTIPAAGSESSGGSVITNEEGQLKYDCLSDLLYPRFALLNPQLCYTLPAEQVAAGGADMIAHVLERYFSRTPHTDLSDRLCEGTLRTLMLYLPRVLLAPDDYDAWSELMWAGSVAHSGLIGMGRQGEWTCHAIEHELSALYDIAHGAGLSIIFPAWMKTVYHAGTPRFVQFAQRVMDVNMAAEETEAIILEGIARMERFFAAIGAPVRLREVGIDAAQFPLIAQRVCAQGPKGFFMPLDRHDVIRILETAL